MHICINTLLYEKFTSYRPRRHSDGAFEHEPKGFGTNGLLYRTFLYTSFIACPDETARLNRCYGTRLARNSFTPSDAPFCITCMERDE